MDLKVFLGLDGSGFQQGMNKATMVVNRFGRETLGGLSSQIAGAFTAGALIAFSKKTIDFAGNMADLADRLSVNVEWLQKLNNAAQQAGGSADDLAGFMGKVGQSREAAATNPKGKEAGIFGRLGFSEADIKSLSQQKFVEKLIASFAEGASVQMDNDIQEVGGKAARKLIATFRQGIDTGGPIISEDIIDQLDELGDAFYILEAGAMADMAPALVKLTKFLTDFADGVRLAAATLGGAWTGLIDGGGMNAMAKQAQNDFAQDLIRRDEAAKQIRLQRKAARAARNNAPPNFDTSGGVDKEVKEAVKKPYTDSLLSVGNFLGAGRHNIERLSRETNTILREHTRLLTGVLAELSKREGAIEVP